MKRPLVSILFLLSTSLTASAGELREQVLEQLSGIEDVPSSEALNALGPGVAQELLEIAQDSTLPRSRRGRAVHALGHVPSDSGRRLLVSTLDGTDSYLARKAVYALGIGWGEDAGRDEPGPRR